MSDTLGHMEEWFLYPCFFPMINWQYWIITMIGLLNVRKYRDDSFLVKKAIKRHHKLIGKDRNNTYLCARITRKDRGQKKSKFEAKYGCIGGLQVSRGPGGEPRGKAGIITASVCWWSLNKIQETPSLKNPGPTGRSHRAMSWSPIWIKASHVNQFNNEVDLLTKDTSRKWLSRKLLDTSDINAHV